MIIDHFKMWSEPSSDSKTVFWTDFVLVGYLMLTTEMDVNSRNQGRCCILGCYSVS